MAPIAPIALLSKLRKNITFQKRATRVCKNTRASSPFSLTGGAGRLDIRALLVEWPGIASYGVLGPVDAVAEPGTSGPITSPDPHERGAAPNTLQSVDAAQFTFVVPTKNGVPGTAREPPNSKFLHSDSVPPGPHP
jgi:hypothetical protein